MGALTIKNLKEDVERIVGDVIAIRLAIRATKARRPGWTHQYMQNWRTAVAAGPKAVTVYCGVVVPILIVGSFFLGGRLL